MSTKKYRVVLRADSSVKIGSRGEKMSLTFNTPEGQVICNYMDIYVQDEYGTDFHKAVQIEVELTVDSIDKALQKGGGISDAFMTMMSFTVGASVSPLKPYLAYDITSGIEKREFIQFFYDIKLPGEAKRKVDFNQYSKLLKELEKSRYEKRLGRAMRWFRKALLEMDTLDKFSNLWFGLEALNKPLKDKFKLDSDEDGLEKRIWAKLSLCFLNRLYRPKEIPQTVIGIRYLMENYLTDGKRIYKRARNVRVGLVHGFENLEYITNEAGFLIPDLEKAIVEAILLLIDIPLAEHDKWITKPLTNQPSPYLKVGVLLHELDLDKLTIARSTPAF